VKWHGRGPAPAPDDVRAAAARWARFWGDDVDVALA
jgi:hypothetical protein